MSRNSDEMVIIHPGKGSGGQMAKLGPYEIETLIPEEMEGAATAYRETIEPHQNTNTSFHRIAEERTAK